jgi:two-component system sensor histidine kinase AtoS
VNIFANSLQAMPQGGTLTIRTSIINGSDSARLVEIQVQDTGAGIPREVIKKIFNPFFTTREKGSGLGLAIVQTIIDNHSGEIDVISLEGCGATMIIRLPLTQPQFDEEGERAQ